MYTFIGHKNSVIMSYELCLEKKIFLKLASGECIPFSWRVNSTRKSIEYCLNVRSRLILWRINSP